jgi:hypothetical protein
MKKIFVVLLFPVLLFSQEVSDSIRTIAITLNDGSYYKGTIIRDDSLQIQLLLPNGANITASKSTIREIKYQITKKSIEFADPSDHRLVITPTARTLKKGKGFVSNSQIFVLSAGYGFIDEIMLTAGITVIPGTINQTYFIVPKARVFSKNNFDVSLGGFYLNTITQNSSPSEGIKSLFLISTYTGSRGSLSIGVGLFNDNNKWGEKPLITISAEYFMFEKTKAILETWSVYGYDGVLFFMGFRSIGEKISSDFGLISAMPQYNNRGIALLPWLNVAYSF